MSVNIAIRLYRGANDPPSIWRFRNADKSPAALADFFVLTIKPLSSPQIEARGPADGLLIDRTNGIVRYVMPDAVAAKISKGDGTYELMGTTSGLTRPWAGGTCSVESWL